MHNKTYLVVLGILIVILSSLLSMRKKVSAQEMWHYPHYYADPTWTVNYSSVPRDRTIGG